MGGPNNRKNLPPFLGILTHKKNEVLMTKKIREISASEVC